MMTTRKNLPADLSLDDLRWMLGGLSAMRIHQLVADGIVERTARGRYALASVPNFIKAQRRAGAGPKGWNDARTELAKERVLAAKQARLEREGKVLPRADVVFAVSTNNKIIRDRMLGLSVKIAPRLFAAESVPQAQLLLDQEIREALTSIADLAGAELMAIIEREAAQRQAS
jgi:hypothetical protein